MRSLGCQFGCWLPPQTLQPPGQSWPTTECPPAKLNSTPIANSFRCVEDREARQHQACTWAAPGGHQRMVQKNFFSRNGFSEAGTGTMRGSSRMWASQYAIRSEAALDTWNVGMQKKKIKKIRLNQSGIDRQIDTVCTAYRGVPALLLALSPVNHSD